MTEEDIKQELKVLGECIALISPLTNEQAERIVVYLQNKFILHQDHT